MRKVIGIFTALSLGLILTGFMSSEFATDYKMKLQNNKLILGDFKLKELKASNNKKWFDAGYKNYSLKPEVIEKIKSKVKKNDFRISVYMGTWCQDSQREFPGFIKLLDQVNFDYKNLILVGVDRDKVVPNISKKEREKLNVTNVPTIIVYSNGKEINRFVEFPQQTLEEDLLKIFSKQDYKHVYDF